MELSRRDVVGAGLTVLGLGLTGCAAGPAPGPSASSAGTSAAPAPRPFVIGATAPATTRDPARAWDSETFRVTRQVYETLLGVDPNTGAPTPQLAERHEILDGGLTHRFTLVDGLRFEDGEPCDAAAVLANLRRWSVPADVADAPPLPAPFVSAFGGWADTPETAFAGVDAPDSRTVLLRLRTPVRHLPAALSSPAFAVTSPSSWTRTLGTGPDAVVTPAGTGPYRFASPVEAAPLLASAAGSSGATALVASSTHRGGAPGVSAAVVAPWGRAGTRLRELRRGTADVIDVVAPGQLRPLVEAGTQVLPRDPLAVLYLGMNLAHPLVRSQYLRQAVAYAVDRPRIARSDVFLEGTALAHDLVPPALGVADETAQRYDVDPARARQLLTLAAYRGEPLELLYPIGTARPWLPEPERIAAMVAGDLGTVGIAVRPVPVPEDQDYLRAVLSRPGRALHLMGRTGQYRDAHAFLEPVARSGRAETNWENPQVLRDLAAAAAEADDARRRDLHRRVVRSMALDLPALPLVYPISALATGPRVASYPTSPQLDEPLARVKVH